MCARHSLTKEEIRIIIGEVEAVIKIQARFNIAPSQKAPVIVAKHDGFAAVDMAWGWHPAWSKQLLINAQANTLEEKPIFKKHIANRCLIPADGLYEWMPDKTPIRFTQPGDEAFCIAGLFYEKVSQPQDVEVTEQRFIVITTAPNKTVGKVHNRMPLIVQPNHYGWRFDDTMYKQVLQYPNREEMQYCPVQRDLNKAGSEGPELIRPAVAQKNLL
jgi:putative SOS response-associated peptidase YedK